MTYEWTSSGWSDYKIIRTTDFNVLYVVFCGKCGEDFRVDDMESVDDINGSYMCKPCFNDINTVKLTMWE